MKIGDVIEYEIPDDHPGVQAGNYSAGDVAPLIVVAVHEATDDTPETVDGFAFHTDGTSGFVRGVTPRGENDDTPESVPQSESIPQPESVPQPQPESVPQNPQPESIPQTTTYNGGNQ